MFVQTCALNNDYVLINGVRLPTRQYGMLKCYLYSGTSEQQTLWDQPFVSLVGRLSSFRKLKMYFIILSTFGDMGNVLCREVVCFSEGPLLEIPL